jgi:enamine deaminase RidA (YjgF/YER057c/UK114 family)
MSVYEQLSTLGISLSAPSAPVASFVPCCRVGNLLFLSGHIAKTDGRPLVGRLGGDLTTDDGRAAARSVAIDLLGTLHATLGDLNNVRRIVKMMVLVNSDPSFREQHLVANGASDLLVEVFGDKGTHARSAFGAAQIPFGSCVEIDLIVEAI